MIKSRVLCNLIIIKNMSKYITDHIIITRLDSKELKMSDPLNGILRIPWKDHLDDTELGKGDIGHHPEYLEYSSHAGVDQLGGHSSGPWISSGGSGPGPGTLSGRVQTPYSEEDGRTVRSWG